MKKTKEQYNPDLCINKQGVLIGRGHFVFGDEDLNDKKPVKASKKKK
jgi:hypothetical protein